MAEQNLVDGAFRGANFNIQDSIGLESVGHGTLASGAATVELLSSVIALRPNSRTHSLTVLAERTLPIFTDFVQLLMNLSN